MGRNWKKKLLSTFLAFTLCLSMVPESALASEVTSGNATVRQEQAATSNNDAEENSYVGTDNGEDKNDDVSAGNGAENSGVENVEENYAEPQNEEGAENGIVLFSTQEPVEYISGVESYDEDGMPVYKTETVADYTELTSELIENSYVMQSGWYVVKADESSLSSVVTECGISIQGEVNLILCDGARLAVYASIEMLEGSKLNIYGQENDSGYFEVMQGTIDSYAFEGTGEVCIYGGKIYLFSGVDEILPAGISISGASQMGRKFIDACGNVVSDLTNLSGITLNVGKCDHAAKKYEASSVEGHETTYHILTCPDCGLKANNGAEIRCFNPDETNAATGHTTSCVCGHTLADSTHTFDENYTCTGCGYICRHEGGLTDGKCTICGYECKHSTLSDGLCKNCGTLFPARIYPSFKLYESISDALMNAQNGDTVTLLTNKQTLDKHAYVVSDEGGAIKTVTLDLNGKTLYCTSTAMIRVGTTEVPAPVYTRDAATVLKLSGKGSIINTSISYADVTYAAVYVSSGSTLDVSGWQGGEISNLGVAGNSGCADGDGAIIGEIPYDAKIGTLNLSNLWQDLKITLNGGSYGRISINNSQDIYAKSILASGYAFKNADGTFLPYESYYKAGTSHEISNVSVILCNHSYLNQPEVFTDGVCNACGYVCTHDTVTDGTCDTCSTVFAAQNVNTGTYYQTLFEALDAAEDGQEVIVTSDNGKNSKSLRIEGKTITLNLNGKTCTDVIIHVGNYEAGVIETGGLILKGTGSFDRIIVNKTSTLDLTGWRGGEINYLSFTSNVNLSTRNMSGRIGQLYLHGVPEESGIALDGGSYDEISFMSTVDNVASTKASSILASGYAFQNADGTFVPYSHIFLASAINATKLENVSVVACSHRYLNQSEVFTDGVCNACGYVCTHDTVTEGICETCSTVFAAQNVNTDTYYQTLNEALDNASDGDTVKVLTDNAMNISSVYIHEKNITLDLNGKTCNLNKCTIYVEKPDTGEASTLKIIGTGDLKQTGIYASVYVGDGCTLDLTGWKGGEIACLSVNYEAKLQAAGMSGTIGEMFLGAISETNGIELGGGSFGYIYGSEIKVGSLLAEGYAFKNSDGMISYNQMLSSYKNEGLTNVSVVKCTAHKDENNDGYCDYCNAGPLVASVNDEYYYTSLLDAWNAVAAMNDGGTVKLLKQLTASEELEIGSALDILNGEIALDLNGFSLPNTPFYVKGKLVLKNSSETAVTIHSAGLVKVNYGDGGRLDIQNDNITVKTLSVASTGAELKHGTFNEIHIQNSDIVLINLAADGYAFADATTGALVDNSLSEIDTPVKIIEHTHKFQGADPCTCGYTCVHEVDADGKCTKCNTQYDAKVVAADGTVTYYAAGTYDNGNSYSGLQIAFEGENAPDGSTVYPLRDQSGTISLLGTDKTRTLDMNGITVNYVNIRVAYSGNQTLILTGEGNINGTVYVQDNGVLKTKDWQGKLGKLYIFDGASIVLDGGTYGSITKSGSCTAGDLLAEGYAFRTEGGNYIDYNKTITDIQGLNDVKVVKCDVHSGNELTSFCEYCNGMFAATVTVGDKVRCFTIDNPAASELTSADAVEYANANNGTLKILGTAGGLAIYDANCTIDLNGAGASKITAGGTALTITGDGPVEELSIQYGSAKLYGGTYFQISTSGSGVKLADLLPEGYGFQKFYDSSWLTEEELTKSGTQLLTGSPADYIKVAEAPVKKLTVSASDISYADELKAEAEAVVDVFTTVVTYKWYMDGMELTDKTEAELILTAADYKNVGTYTIKCVASSGTYVVSKEVTVTVKQADLKDASLVITNEDKLVYTLINSEKDSGITWDVLPEVTYKNTILKADTDYEIVGADQVKDVGGYMLTVYGKGNYTGDKTVVFEVKPCVLTTKTSISNLIKTYDGTADIPLEQLDNVGFVPETSSLTVYFDRGTDYTVERAEFDSADAGDGKTAIIKFKMLNPNYSFANGEKELEIVRRYGIDSGNAIQEIEKAAAANQSVELKVTNGHATTYTVNLTKMLSKLTAPQKYGEITYSTPTMILNDGYYAVNSAKIENGVLRLPIKRVNTDIEGDIGTISVVVSTTNYEDMTLTINVKATNENTLVPEGEPTLSKAALTYGEKLGDITLSGSMKCEGATVYGTFAWVTPNARPNATAYYMAEWIFTPSDSITYETVNGTVWIPVNKATPQVTELPITAAQAYNPSKALSNSDLTGGKVTDINGNPVAGTWSWQNTEIIPTVDNMGYTAVFTPADSANYEQAAVTVTVNVVKAMPIIAEKPTAADITYGKKLGASVLSGGTAIYSDSDNTVISGTFKWQYEDILPTAADSNTTKYVVIFVPSDTVNYVTAQTEITVTVHKASVAPVMPDKTINVPNSTEKVGEVSLPYGWVWQNADKDTLLNVNEAVNATAVYNGTDKGNYETESMVISITRAEADNDNSGDVTGDNTKQDDNAGDNTKQDGNTEDDTKQDNNTEKPFIKNDSSKSGWELITEQIEAAKNGETVTVDMNGATVVPSGVFERFKDKDVKVLFDMGDGIVWTVNGKDVTDIKGDINLGVTFGSEAGKTIPVDVINKVTSERYSVNLTLAYSGEFGFTATLTVNMQKENAGYYANLFYYNPDSNELEFVCADRVDDAGNVNLTFTHASDYTIVLTDTVIDAIEPLEPGDSSVTWGMQWIILLGCVVIIIGLGIFFIIKKKSDNRDE